MNLLTEMRIRHTMLTITLIVGLFSVFGCYSSGTTTSQRQIAPPAAGAEEDAYEGAVGAETGAVSTEVAPSGEESALPLEATPPVAASLEYPPEIVVQVGHSERVNAVAVSPDGRLLLTGSEDASVKVWELKTGRLIRTLSNHVQGVNTVAFAPDGTYAIAGSDDRKATLWNVVSGDVVREFGSASPYLSVAFSPDGRYFISGHYHDKAYLRNIETNQIVHQFDHEGVVSSVAFSPDGRSVLTGSSDRVARLWDFESGREIRAFDAHTRGRNGGIHSVAFSPDGRLIVTASSDNAVRVWDRDSGEIVQTVHTTAQDVVWTPGGDLLFIGEGDNAVLRRIDDGGTVRTVTHRLIKTVAVSPDGSWGVTGASDGTASLWDLNTGTMAVAYKSGVEVNEQYRAAEISPDGRYAVTNGSGNAALLWDVATGRRIVSLTGHDERVASVGFSFDGELVATGSDDGSTTLWDVASGRKIWSFSNDGPGVTALSFSSDGRYLVAGYGLLREERVTVLEMDTGRRVHLLKSDHGTNASVVALDFSPLGDEFISAYGRSITVWDASSGTQIRQWTADANSLVDDAAYTPDGQFVVTTSDNPDTEDKVVVWNADTGQKVRSFGRFLGDPNALSISMTGTLVAVAQFESTLVFDWSTGEQLQRIQGHSTQVMDVAFTPDNGRILTAGLDSTIQFSDTESGERIYTAVTSLDDRSLSWTPDGYFAGDREMATGMIAVARGLRVLSLDQLFEQFYRPDVIAVRADDGDTDTIVEARTLAQTLVPLPEVTIEVEGSNGLFRTIGTESLLATGSTDSPIRVNDGHVRLRVTVHDTGGGAEDLRLYHNGGRVAGSGRGLARSDGDSGAAIRETFVVTLADGENVFRAVAFTPTRVESDPAHGILIFDAPQRTRPVLRLLAVGINRYRNPRYDLNYAVSDARAFAEAVERSGRLIYDDIDATVILDDRVTRDQIRTALAAIAERAAPEDVFVFFYAGHGIALQTGDRDTTEFFFISHDVTQMTSIEQVERLAVAGREFEELVTAIPARKQFYVLDACNAGAINSAFGVRGAGEEIALSRLSRATGSALIAASRDDQFAQEFVALGQGALTRAVLDGLNGEASGDDDEITVGELKSYVDRTVPRLTSEYSGQPQFPTGFTFGQDFPLGMR